MNLARLYKRRAFQLDNVSLRIGDIDRRSLTVGSVTRFNISGLKSSALQELEDPISIERLDPSTTPVIG